VTRFGEPPLLEDILAGRSDEPALVVFGSTPPGLSRGELRGAAHAGARYLARHGFKRGDVLAVWLPNTLSWLQILFAAARLGVLVVPISTRYQSQEVKHLLEVSRAKGMVAPRQFLDVDYAQIAEQLRAEVPTLEQIFIQEDLATCIPWTDFVPSKSVDSSAEELATDPASLGREYLSNERVALGKNLLSCFSTSGTTGYPKLAAHDHASIARHALQVARALDLHPGDVMLCPLPLFGVFGYMAAMAALAGGASCVLMPVCDAVDAARAVEQYRVTHVIGADAMFDAMFNVKGTNFSTWRRGVQADFVGLPLQVTQRGDDLGIKFSGTYGSSECFSLMSFQDWNGAAEQRAQAGGIPSDPATLVRIVDPDSGHEVSPGEPGEIQIYGPNVLAEYLNNPQASLKAKTADGWYRSGDLGYLEPDQDREPGGGKAFRYLARMGDSLRLRGYLVNPSEIETCLMEHPLVSGAQVVGVNRPGVGDIAVAYVTSSKAESLESMDKGAGLEPELIKHCKGRLAAYKVPLRVILIEEFPAINGPNGNKIQKRQLRDMAVEALKQ
jgi:acyl-CoA synthetase (AMP-forming)/AMP-acid ligase II